MKMKKEKEEEPTKTEDSILAGILKTMGLSVSGYVNGNGRVLFLIKGDYEGALRKIYENTLVGAADVFQNIKLCRQMIFALRGQGYEKGDGHARR
jgi:hypothetical protein